MRIYLCCIMLVLFANVEAQTKTVYDSALAKKFGADDYGMKQYVMVFLKAGPVKVTDSAQRNQLLQGHLQNIMRLAKEGKLLVAGPFLDKTDIAGIFIFDVRTIDEARTVVNTDPAVRAGMFDVELHPWYASAALMQVGSVHEKLQKKSFTH
ncbi:MAG TPA: YciI family protein [Flavisolibacter sp.]|nr:YciI family protein [Flavisolibacter sp.]